MKKIKKKTERVSKLTRSEDIAKVSDIMFQTVKKGKTALKRSL